MLRSFFLIGTTCLWITMMGLHVHREYFELKPIYAPYQVLPLHNLYLREEYRGIYLGDTLIGFALNVLERLEAPASEAGEKDKTPPSAEAKSPEDALYELRHHTYMTFLFLGEEREMLIRSKALLNARLEMESFAMRVSSGEYLTEMEGILKQGKMHLTVKEKDANPVQKDITAAPPLFFSESLSMIWTPENLTPGRKGKLRIWNPLAMGIEEVEFRVGEKENIEHEGEEKKTIVIHLMEQGVETRYWVTPEGILLKHESPTGLVLKKEEAYKIFDGLRETRGELPDLPNLYSIPADKEIGNPADLKYLKAVITAPGIERTIENKAADTTFAQKAALLETVPEELKPFTAADEFIQSDHPLIKEKAFEIAGSEKNVWAIALKLTGWVNRNVQPIPTISVPSAVQVLKFREGDCNEYTALFTALARSLGIPTRMMAGLVYQQGRFFYHAWPEIHAGTWIPLDPTFGQVPADVTHLPLVEGNLREQIDLVRKLGKIKIEILETA